MTLEEIYTHSVLHESGCRLWIGLKNVRGYGRTRVRGKPALAHRAAFEAVHGAIAPGLCICHRCDTPSCVNVDHLFAATQFENMQDMARKGRAPETKGEKCGKAKLRESDVEEIVRRLAAGEPGTHIAADFGMSNTAIYSIKNAKRWQHLPVVAQRTALA